MPHDITDLRFFVTITESGSLAEAARRLDVTPSAVSQRLRHLETRLGMQLAHRSTRRFTLTEEGELFHAGVVQLLADLDGLVDTLRERSGEVAGTLHVGGPLGFGRHYLAPAIAEFHALHPKLMVSLTLSDVVSAADANRFDMTRAHRHAGGFQHGGLPDRAELAVRLRGAELPREPSGAGRAEGPRRS